MHSALVKLRFLEVNGPDQATEMLQNAQNLKAIVPKPNAAEFD